MPTWSCFRHAWEGAVKVKPRFYNRKSIDKV